MKSLPELFKEVDEALWCHSTVKCKGVAGEKSARAALREIAKQWPADDALDILKALGEEP